LKPALILDERAIRFGSLLLHGAWKRALILDERASTLTSRCGWRTGAWGVEWLRERLQRGDTQVALFRYLDTVEEAAEMAAEGELEAKEAAVEVAAA
jgi:hypothetical protein